MYEVIIDQEGTLVRYWENVFDEDIDLLKGIPFNDEKVFVYGKWHSPNRKTVAYGDAGTSYKYSGVNRIPLSWDSSDTCNIILGIKQKVEEILEQEFNFVLCQMYPDGTSKIGWHSDDERDLRENSIIASVSFGATRTFQLKHKLTKELISVDLTNGSLITMEGRCQKDYIHCVPQRKKVKDMRINLTFRQIIV